MRIQTKNLFISSLVVSLGLVTPAFAEISVLAKHQVVNVAANGANTNITVELVISNEGESVQQLSLVPLESYFYIGADPTIAVGDMAAGETRVLTWSSTSSYPPEFFALPRMFAFHGRADGSLSGDITFAVVSDTEVQQ